MSDVPHETDPEAGQAGEEGKEKGSDGVFNTMFIVPPKLSEGDFLTPFQFDVFDNSKKFCFFGRYNAEKDAVEFALAGSAGSAYKLCISDGNSPYGWKVKRHGVTKTSPTDLGGGGGTVDRFLDMVGQKQGGDGGDGGEGGAEQDPVQTEAFENEDIVAVPHAMMRSSSRQGIMDAKHECVKPWSFYGPSLPEYFCRCKVKVIVYGEEDDHAEKMKAAEEGAGGDGTTGGPSLGMLGEEDGEGGPTGTAGSAAGATQAEPTGQSQGAEQQKAPTGGSGTKKSGKDSLDELLGDDDDDLNIDLDKDFGDTADKEEDEKAGVMTDDDMEFSFPPPPP